MNIWIAIIAVLIVSAIYVILSYVIFLNRSTYEIINKFSVEEWGDTKYYFSFRKVNGKNEGFTLKVSEEIYYLYDISDEIIFTF